ncbi:MAG TPA: carbohydrate kinase family protein, partial [Victivallales bacterium]|nr:carbohydrate kinase family protein [Victivallales bacterium]
SLDMSLPDPDSFYGKLNWKGILKKILPYVDIFLPSLEEAFYMFEKEKYFALKKRTTGGEFSFCVSCDEIAKIAKKAIKMGCKISILKLGTRGWIFESSNISSDDNFKKILGENSINWDRRKLWCPAFKADNFVGATGSGDCSIAGFLRAFSMGLSPEEAVKSAVCLGWQNVQKADALSGIRSWEETLRLIKSSDMEIIDPRLDSGWIFDKRNKIWKK